MKITDMIFGVEKIIDIQKGHISPSEIYCNKRRSDCFVYVLSGEATYRFEKNNITAKAGNVIYLAHNSAYSIHVTNDNYKFIFVDFYFNNQTNDCLKNQIYQSQSISILENKFKKIYSLWTIGDIADKIYCHSVLYQIYGEIAKSDLSTYVSGKHKAQLQQISEYMNQNLHDSHLSISSLSRMCNISEVHFRRLFSQVYHTSPIKFLTDLRLRKAKELLISNSLTIAEVAEKCGFQNAYYFSKVFKANLNMTPSQYREFFP